MNRSTWAAVAFPVPLFGFFAPLLERSETRPAGASRSRERGAKRAASRERATDSGEAPHADGASNFHESVVGTASREDRAAHSSGTDRRETAEHSDAADQSDGIAASAGTARRDGTERP